MAFLHVRRRRPAPLPRGLSAAATRARPRRGDDRHRPRAPPAARRPRRPPRRASRRAPRGHAVQARLNAEDPERGFAPAPGLVARLRLGAGPGVRVDAAVAEGDVLAPGDPMLVAQVLAWGPTRDEARVRLRRALDETTVVIDGGSTNKGFLLDVLDRPEVREARGRQRLRRPHRRPGRDRRRARRRPRPARRRDRRLRDRARRRPGPLLRVGAARSPSDRARASAAPSSSATAATRYRLHVDRPGPSTLRRRARRGDGADRPRAARTLRATAAPRIAVRRGSCRPCRASEHLVEVDGTPHRFRRDDQGIVRSPTPGVVVALPVAAGDEVAAGDPVAVIESMKMETAVPGAVRRAGPGPARRPERAGRHRRRPWCSSTRPDRIPTPSIRRPA